MSEPASSWLSFSIADMPLATFSDTLRYLLGGVGVTVSLATLSFVIALLIGIPLAAGDRTRFRLIRWPVRWAIDIVRSVPIIVWVFIVFFGLAEKGLSLSAYMASVLALGGWLGCYCAEMYKSSLAAVDPRQWEAARALGLGPLDTYRFVVGPQAVRVMLPSAGAYYISLLKDTAIASTIGVSDITGRAFTWSQLHGDPTGTFLTAGLIYILLCLPVAILTRRAYRRMLRSRPT